MSTRGLLPGTSDDPTMDQLILENRRLIGENARLSEALEHAIDDKNSMRDELRDLQEAVKSMRTQLSPLYRALCGLFGELDRVSKETDFSTPGAPQAAHSKVWQSWKQKMPGKPADFIDALLEHGELNHQQLGIVTGTTRKQTIYDTISKLNKAGLLNKNGDRFSLKQL